MGTAQVRFNFGMAAASGENLFVSFFAVPYLLIMVVFPVVGTVGVVEDSLFVVRDLCCLFHEANLQFLVANSFFVGLRKCCGELRPEFPFISGGRVGIEVGLRGGVACKWFRGRFGRRLGGLRVGVWWSLEGVLADMLPVVCVIPTEMFNIKKEVNVVCIIAVEANGTP